MPRRLAITGPYQIELLDYEDPALTANQVLVKTELASGKHGTTTAQFDNRSFSGQRFDESLRLFVEDDSAVSLPTREAPWPMGTTGVGTVIAVGSGVTRWQVGAKVFGLMDIRETNVCEQERLWALGDIDPLATLCIEPAFVAFHCVRESNVRYGDSVAVIGLGALGLLAVAMARESGAETVIGIDLVVKRRELALKLGADYALDPRGEDVAVRTHQLTGGAGVDVAIELGGAYQALQTAIRCARMAGTVCSAGFYQGEAHSLWLGREWHHNRLTMIVPHGCGWGHVPRDYPRWDRWRAYDTLASMLRKGRLPALGLIDPILPFEQGATIFDAIRDHSEAVIKYAIRFD
ncbi:MAG: zinc-binding alcohol dehydrogenase [Burkholderiales bacterium]|nr:zinc-binding alcohol dehydrogenase [Anaerolineae bacterium]